MTINRDTAFACSEWLKGLNNIVEAEPVLVKFGNHKFFGALYGTKEPYMDFERAVTSGVVAAGESRVEYSLYLLGVAPTKLNSRVFSSNVFVWKHGRKTDERAYRSSGEWYRKCYYDGKCRWSGTQPFEEAHPFGFSFILGEHSIHTYGYYKDKPIDWAEEKPYIRNDMTVEILK